MKTKHPALLAWLKTATPEQIAGTGTTLGYLRQIAHGNRIASAETAVGIERESAGAITRQMLRPDDWQRIWPELAAA